MKFKRTKTTRKITKLLAMTMLSEQIMMAAPVINAHAAEETPAEYSIEYNVTSPWGSGCVAELTLNNLADADTENWTVSFCTKDEITNLWGGRITERKELLVSDASVEVYATVETDVEEEAEERIANEDMTEEEPTSEKAAMEEKSVEEAVEADTEKEITEGGKDTSDSVETTERKTEDVSETELSEEELTDLLEEEYKEVLEEDLFEEDFPDEETEEETEEEKNTYFRYTVEALDYNAVIPAGGSVTIGYNAIGDDQAIWDEKAEIILKETAEEEDTIPTGGIYEDDGYTVEVVIPAHWDGTYNVQLRITNTSEKTLHNWAFVMGTKDSISGLYNAMELSDNNGVHLIKNVGYYQDILAGGTVEVGYTASYDGRPDVPAEFALSQMEKEVTTAECEVSLFITEEWEDGGLAEIVLTNISGLPIEDWMLEFDSTLDIEEIWGGVIESHEGEHYFLRNSGYAQNILPGESWIIGMIYSGNATDMGNINLKQIVANDKKELAEKEIIDDISIIELDTSMAENSVGRIWFKELISDDEIICSSDGLLCVRDQILLTTIGKNYEEVEDFVKKYDARIVGCIELTGDYQIEFNHTLEVEELESFVNTFKCESFIRSSELNYIWLESPDFNTTDPWKEGAEEDWLIGGVADGSNWALEAIDYVDALVEAEIIDDSGTVKLE
ncbi:MAG: cellulose binding domain-containing protein [Lachnospiraceae bacterium]|nr:cellulose binding domain-containing protein [Lachnospiraceae bacterium]